MPGFTRGMTPFDFARNINLITGPNASGKSSTSRLIQKIIWPFETKGLDAHAELEIDNETWQIKIESEGVKVQRNGIDSVIPGIPAKEGCHRYLLPLHDLIKENESDLAREILKASIGGYDLDEAKNTLNYSRTVKNSAANEFKEVDRINKEHQKVVKEHQDLKRDEEKLRSLKEESDQARQASQLSRFYEITAEFIETKLKVENLLSQKEAFPSSMEVVTGEELTMIENLENQISEAVGNIQIAESRISEEQDKIDGLQISDTEIPETTLTILETRLEKIKSLSQRLADLKTELFSKHQERHEAVIAIDKTMDPLDWEGLNLSTIEKLDEFTQKSYQTLGKKENLDNEKRRLKEESEKTQDVPFEAESILQGIKYLGSWIQEQETAGGIPNWLIPGLAVLGIITGVATFLFGWPGLLGILFIVGLALFVSKGKNNSNSHSVREKDFKDLNLPLPTGWTIESVTEHINELLHLLRQSKLKEGTRLRIRELDRELEGLSPELNKIQEDYKKWREKIGTAPLLTENDFGGLYWFLHNAREWQKAHTTYKALERQKTGTKKELENELKEFNTLLKECNIQPANNDTEADAEFKNLRKQLSSKKDAESNIRNQQVELNGYKRNKTDASDKLVALYENLAIPEGDKATVKYLIENLNTYKDINQNLFASNQRLLEKESSLKNNPLYTELEDSLESLTLDQAEEKVRENEEIASRLEGISKEITQIETLINNKKKGHELEDLLTEKQSALESLLNLYQDNLSSVTGDLIVEQLKAETREQNRPQVFKRANVLFNKITNGRYELRLDDNDMPAFRAYDTVLKQGLNLSEVSTGTRVQLLLAVRLAYVESQEKEIRLPILADELLANSDDERAAAIIKALIEISKEGRQIFYFTAQADEVYKWESVLKEEKEIEYKVISLKDHRNQSNGIYASSENFRFQEVMEKPGTLSHTEYGKLLEVESFNPLIQDSTQVHLWYLIEDVELLYKCLSKGLKTWGQLESFRRLDGKIEGMTNEAVVKIENKAKLLDRLIYLIRKGRTIPINREVLENSEAVSSRFIEQLSEKLEDLQGNPEDLLEALENSQVSGFRMDNINKLRKYLIDQEILHEEEPLTNEEITTQLSAVISRIELSVGEAEDFCNRILQTEVSQSRIG